MLTQFLKLTIRHQRAQKAYSIINVLGLSPGLAACFIILVYVLFQTSFDKYNQELNNIYLISSERPSFGMTEPWTPQALATSIKAELPEAREIARWHRLGSTIRYKDKVLAECACAYSDPDVFRILTLPIVNGNVNAPGRDFFVISESMAKKYFGDINPVGETVTVSCSGETYNLTVSAVMEDIPRTSTFVADAIGPIHVWEEFSAKNWSYTNPATVWDVLSVATYLLLPSSVDRGEVERKIVEMSKRHSHPSNTILHHLFPLRDLYFHSSAMANNVFPQGNIVNVYVYSAAAFLLLCVACVNYLLLNLGRASLRAKEIGIRKVFGARKGVLFGQMTVEATAIALVSLPLAVIFVELFLQKISTLLGARIASSYFHQWGYILAFLVLTLLVGCISGGYVSLYLARLNPVDTLKNKVPIGPGKVVLRRVLMTTQMVIFIGLTFASMAIRKQLVFFQQGDMGFAASQILVLYPDDKEFGRSFDAFKNELRSIPEVISVTGAIILPGSESFGVSKIPRKDNPAQFVSVEGISVDRDFIETMGLTIIAGVSLSGVARHGSGHDCIVNETAVRELGLSNPIGEEVGGSRIIGVVQDFHQHSFREKIPPLMISEGTQYLNEIAVRISPEKTSSCAQRIAEIAKKFNNGKPLDFESFDERLGGLYLEEHKFASIIEYATGVAILVASLGLFGMSAFVCQQRVKEIGIRKVLGASVRDVYLMVTKEFLGLIVLSAVIAFPLAYFVVNQWFQRFAYHTELNLWDLLLAVKIDVVVVLLTISIHVVRAATVNPVMSRRYE